MPSCQSYGGFSSCSPHHIPASNPLKRCQYPKHVQYIAPETTVQQLQHTSSCAQPFGETSILHFAGFCATAYSKLATTRQKCLTGGNQGQRIAG